MTLTPEAFAALLDRLGAAPGPAAEVYERVRRKLVTFFAYRDCSSPDEYADETIDRVARRLAGGAELRVEDPYLYFHGVAVNVLREYRRDAERGVGALDELPPHRVPSENPIDLERRREERDLKERRIECLEGCLAKLPAGQADLIVDYYHGESVNKERRRGMAEALGVSANSLKIRVFRIKTSLEACVVVCLERTTG